MPITHHNTAWPPLHVRRCNVGRARSDGDRIERRDVRQFWSSYPPPAHRCMLHQIVGRPTAPSASAWVSGDAPWSLHGKLRFCYSCPWMDVVEIFVTDIFSFYFYNSSSPPLSSSCLMIPTVLKRSGVVHESRGPSDSGSACSGVGVCSTIGVWTDDEGMSPTRGGELESFFPFYDILIKKPRGVKHDALCLRCLLVSPNIYFKTKKSINYIHPLEKIYTWFKNEGSIMRYIIYLHDFEQGSLSVFFLQ